MTAASKASAKPTRKRMSTTAKVFWILLALLFVVVAGFVFSAWRELNRIAPPVANPAAGSTQQVEVLTPMGASQNVPTFVPGKNNAVATASAPATTTTPAAATPKPGTNTETALKTGSSNIVETPLQPINVPAAKPAATDKTAEKPAAKPKNTLDNLF
ncbi:hypothetical protein [Paralysiella testudinis]|uniref:Uncharacterized protein n=1 Tax=Paralysiella testudinis TaxID=2809020 RepID=A0A892ZJQ6_9NEIS|nr:hypothetical protein [Paralysiella testudinis]QRQ83162.1 hypothetical protein JQU52_07350 [Paralysiella testudinis]